ncbi:unnamed protein product [Prorocentrum cordatum]|uniref:Uncharacterized protein n=1 Tax=Prorocentrum cordatum TaxID=2364126 RepID=A0ABN9VC69_9DINO|nr:unnamed protein product [Polarella glacialis]
MLSAMVKKFIINTKQLREIRGQIYDTYLWGIRIKAVQAMQSAGAADAAAMKDKGNGHSFGPPAVAVFMYLVKTMLEMEIGAVSRKGLEDLVGQLKDKKPWDIVRLCHACRLERCFDENQIKIALAIPSPDTRKLSRNAMEQMGATTTISQAPAGYLEEEEALGAYADMLS